MISRILFKMMFPPLFLSFTSDWDETSPIDHTKFKVQPSHVRNFKVDISDRIKNFFYGFTAGETTEGAKKIEYYTQTTAPSSASDKMVSYAKDVSGIAEWFLKDENGVEIQVTSNGKINLSASIIPNNSYLIAKDSTGTGTVGLIKANTSNVPCLGAGVVIDGTADPASDYAVAHKKYTLEKAVKTLVYFIAGTIGTGTNYSAALRLPLSGTITKARARVKTAPTGASMLIDINLNGTSIWASTQANRLTIAASGTYDDETSFDTTAYTAEDEVTVDIDQVGSSVAGADLTIELDVKPT